MDKISIRELKNRILRQIEQYPGYCIEVIESEVDKYEFDITKTKYEESDTIRRRYIYTPHNTKTITHIQRELEMFLKDDLDDLDPQYVLLIDKLNDTKNASDFGSACDILITYYMAKDVIGIKVTYEGKTYLDGEMDYDLFKDLVDNYLYDFFETLEQAVDREHTISMRDLCDDIENYLDMIAQEENEQWRREHELILDED